MKYSVTSEKYGDLSTSDRETVLSFVQAAEYGPSRNFYSDSLIALEIGQQLSLRDGLDRLTTIKRES